MPHWEVRGARYFVTVRCADCLPVEIVERLRGIHLDLQRIEARSDQFAQLQRQYFATMEKYLDQGSGECPLRDRGVANYLVEEFRRLREEQILVSHYSVMPNHWHILIGPEGRETFDLKETIARLKGRTAREINVSLRRSGALWQREWFDRWMRNDQEAERCAKYILQNPVKAGLVTRWTDHPFTGVQSSNQSAQDEKRAEPVRKTGANDSPGSFAG